MTEEAFITSPSELLKQKGLKCELCQQESDKIETLSLCPACFNKVNDRTVILLLENGLLKFILRDVLSKKGEKENGHRSS